MDASVKKLSSEVLKLVNQLYNENQREEALESIARFQCDLDVLSSCVYNSFGIVSILQQEILSIYPFLSSDAIDDNMQKRVCNALLILRSLIAAKQPKMTTADLYILFYLNPILESPKEAFSNLRKVSLGVIISVVTCRSYQLFLPKLIEFNVISSCINNLSNMTATEITSVFYLLNSLFSNPQMIKLFFTKNRSELFIGNVSYVMQTKISINDNKLLSLLNSLLSLLNKPGYGQIVDVIKNNVPQDIWRALCLSKQNMTE